MGSAASKKGSTTSSSLFEPKPQQNNRLEPSYIRHQQAIPRIVAPTAINHASLPLSIHVWDQSLTAYNETKRNNDFYQTRIAEKAACFKKQRELEEKAAMLSRDRDKALSEMYTIHKPRPITSTKLSFMPIISYLQSQKENDAKYFSVTRKRPELTDQMVRHINLQKTAPHNALLTEIDGVQILGKDIRTLVGLNWLNDEIINAYMTLIAWRGKKAGYKTVHSFNTFFYPKLRESGYNSIRRWTRKVDVFSFDYIVVPVHLGNHWTLVFIDFIEKTISYYDSLGGYQDGYCDTLLDYLRSEMTDKKKREFDDSGWQLLNRSMDGIPQQNNCSDCGVFACVYAEHLTRGAEFHFSQKDMPYFRDRMIYEITTQKILE